MKMVKRKKDFIDIGKIYTDNWKNTYAGLLDSNYLSSLTYEDAQRKWHDYSLRDKALVTVITDDDGNVCAFSGCAPSPEINDAMALNYSACPFRHTRQRAQVES